MVAVHMQHITKRFGRVLANDDVELTITKGEIHALVGENGAGKSTLMHILYGIYQQDNGTITVGNTIATINSPADAIQLGIGMVHQHFMLIPPLTVVENIILGNEPTSYVQIIDRLKAEQSVTALSESFHLAIDPKAKIESLSVGMQQRVEILKLLYRNAEILILDEPTPVLTPQEIDDLFETLLHLKHQGKTIILITHKLNEVMSITDRVTVMRHGKVIASIPTKETNQQELARMMVGRDLIPLQASLTTSSSEIGLALERISALNDRHLPALHDISLTIAKKEILGIAAIEGNGQSELIQVITGLRVPSNGKILIDGIDILHSKTNIPVSHIPEDRQKRGLVLEFTLKENILLGRQNEKQFNAAFSINQTAVGIFAEDILERFDVRPLNVNQRARNLSGGNQQKVVIGRELTKNATVIIASQPTRGLDIGAIEFVHRTLLHERDLGKSIMLVSSDLDELLSLSDRIAVMYEGRIVFLTETRRTTQRELGQYMTGTLRQTA